jgi:hypothetical protein
MMYTYSCDVAWECPIKDVAVIMECTDAAMRVINSEGPGGGNPYLEFLFKSASDRQQFIEYVENA